MTTLTGNSREREQRLQSLMLDRLVARYERRIAREIARAMRAGAKLVRDGASAEFMLSEHKERLRKLMIPMYRNVSETFAEYLAKNKRFNQALDRLKQRGEVPTTPIVDAMINEWVAQFGGDHITSISSTTLDDIRAIVQNGVSEGLSEREIAQQIANVAPTKSASRAQTIARTETHAAANATMQRTAKEMRVEMLKEWVPAGSRTRDAHERAGRDYGDGNGIPLDDPFIVDGERLRYPGDPAGSPENVINCRCAVVYEVL